MADFQGTWTGAPVANPLTTTVVLEAGDVGEIRLRDASLNTKIGLHPKLGVDSATFECNTPGRSAVYGFTNAERGFAVRGQNTDTGAEGFLAGPAHDPIPFDAFPTKSVGVAGQCLLSKTGVGVLGIGGFYGVFGFTKSGSAGVQGYSTDGIGVYAHSAESSAVRADTYSSAPNTAAVFGMSWKTARGVLGGSKNAVGTSGASVTGWGILAWSQNTYAAHISGDINITGTLYAADKNFKIDHPLEPATKYLVHSCVESSERLNLYSGIANLDAKVNCGSICLIGSERSMLTSDIK
jgi:hypothetical protein